MVTTLVEAFAQAAATASAPSETACMASRRPCAASCAAKCSSALPWQQVAWLITAMAASMAEAAAPARSAPSVASECSLSTSRKTSAAVCCGSSGSGRSGAGLPQLRSRGGFGGEFASALRSRRGVSGACGGCLGLASAERSRLGADCGAEFSREALLRGGSAACGFAGRTPRLRSSIILSCACCRAWKVAVSPPLSGWCRRHMSRYARLISASEASHSTPRIA
mmetsp:Transcript_123720/g.361280  ORF Transcript_123720/g.361280 Transcript_123720/m.361280 type:complete len:224 (+) Transcript_123720:186-857(+)